MNDELLSARSHDPEKALPHAVIFTHFGKLKYGDDRCESLFLDRQFDEWRRACLQYWGRKENTLRTTYTNILTKYVACAESGKLLDIVYVYVDWAVRLSVNARVWEHPSPRDPKTFQIDGDLVAGENQLKALLHFAEADARRQVRRGVTKPKFHYIGLVELVGLLNELVRIDEKLMGMLRAPDGKFTYDSPKFVEAVIRLCRGDVAHLAGSPVIRLDEDVEPNQVAVQRLLEEYAAVSSRKAFFFFSGRYGDPNLEKPVDDPINDFAVRTHWFAPLGHCKGDPLEKTARSTINTFLADLTELGATQLPDSSDLYSTGLKELLNRKKDRLRAQSRVHQVISGAGLIMSCRAINFLPPFMNVLDLTTWVDDYLKRRLHEALGDVQPDDLESVSTAHFSQDRHLRPYGVQQKDHNYARDRYFDCLLRGCLFRHLILELDGSATNYARLIDRIVSYRVRTGDPRLDRDSPERQSLRREMLGRAAERYGEVMASWRSEEFSGLLRDWALSKGNLPEDLEDWDRASPRLPEHCVNICKNLVKDAEDYIDLVQQWPVFVRAIHRLPFTDWLYDYVT